MSTSYCDRYDFHRAYGHYPEDEPAAQAEPEPEVTAKVVSPKRRAAPKTSRSAETKSAGPEGD